MAVDVSDGAELSRNFDLPLPDSVDLATPPVVIKILLVGSQPVSLAGLRALMGTEPDIEVIGLRDPKDGPFPVTSATADVALVDHGEHDVLEDLIAFVDATYDRPPLIVLTSATAPAMIATAFRHGARGVVSRSDAPEILLRAVRKVHAGEIWLKHTLMTTLVTDLLDATDRKLQTTGSPSLSDRDHQIVTLVAQGLRNGEIASQIHVSEATVRNQLTSIFRRLGVSGRFQLVVYACRHGLVNLTSPTEPRRSKRLMRLV